MIVGFILVGFAAALALVALGFVVWAIRRWTEEAAIVAFIAVAVLGSAVFGVGEEGIKRLDKWEARQTEGR